MNQRHDFESILFHSFVPAGRAVIRNCQNQIPHATKKRQHQVTTQDMSKSKNIRLSEMRVLIPAYAVLEAI